MNVIEVSISSVENDLDLQKIRTFCEKVLDHEKIDNWELSVLFCSDTFIQDLNNRYRGKDIPTDILSFRQSYKNPENIQQVAGDIVISTETLEANSRELNIRKEVELKRLIIHGILHLTGMEHTSNDLSDKMIAKQEVILEELTGEELF